MKQDYKSDFDRSVAELESLAVDLNHLTLIADVNKLERTAQQKLYAIQHTSMGLGYWVKSMFDAKRKELREAPVFPVEPVAEEPEELREAPVFPVEPVAEEPEELREEKKKD